MNDIAAARMEPIATRLANAVSIRDSQTVAELLTPLGTSDLYALAVVLADRVRPTLTDAERLREAAHAIGLRFGTTDHAILSASRRREDLDGRACLMYVGYLLGMSYAAIGRHVGRDHSTVMHACGRVGETPRLRTCAEQIAARLGRIREDETA